MCFTPLFFLTPRPPPRSTLFPYTTLFRSSLVGTPPASPLGVRGRAPELDTDGGLVADDPSVVARRDQVRAAGLEDRKSTRLNSSHVEISYAVFCLKKKKILYNDDSNVD